MANSIRLISEAGKTLFITPQYKKFLLRAELATITSRRPLVLKLTDDAYCPEFLEEQRHLSGRINRITKRKVSTFKNARVGRKSTRAKPPRHHINGVEREFQRHKTAFLRKQSEEEAERVRLRSGQPEH